MSMHNMRTGVGLQPVLLSLSLDTKLCMFLHFKHDKKCNTIS